jgi:rhodanese-related sulfurtransferase
MTGNTKPLNRLNRTALAACLTAATVMLGACGPTGTEGVAMTDVAQAAARGEDRVSVHELATWLIEGRGDFLLVDVRLPDEFAAGAIDEAKNIPIAQLASSDSLAALPTDRKVVVYSNGSENAAKAVVMLRLSGINGQVLVGGYNAWHSRILNPDITAESVDGEALKVSEQRAYACYFVGECAGATAASAPAEPFVPPVFVETEEAEELPPPAAEEGC